MRVILLLSVITALGCGLMGLRKHSYPIRVICIYLGLTLISELAAFGMARVYRNNMPIFHVFSPLLFAALAYYFQQISPTVRSYRLGYWSIFLCLVISVVNTIMLQPFHTMNSNYLLLEGLFGCGLAFITLYDFLRDDKYIFMHRSVHFWITTIILVHYLGTYISYLALRLLKVTGATSCLEVIYTMIWLLTVVNYLALGASCLLSNRKMQCDE